MSQHTAGPWKVNGNIGRKSELGIVADAAPCIIAIMGNQKEWPAEAQANAVLIAAAPDLLAALIWAVSQIDDDLDHQAALRAAHGAISKAKGEL